MSERTCSIPDCPKRVQACGWCAMHYRRFLRNGDPLVKGQPRSSASQSARARRHGHAREGAMSPEYRAWLDMRQRCSNPKDTGYYLYGARGITVCQAWRAAFEAFLADVGPRPSPQHSLDRIDNDGDYEPGNVRWATRQQQQRNKRVRSRITWAGKSLVVAEWAERTGLPSHMISARLASGWTPERALTTPPQRTGLWRQREGGEPPSQQDQ